MRTEPAPAPTPAPIPTATTAPVAARARLLPIDGMSCASCVGRVEKALARVPGVTEARVNLATNQAQVKAAAEVSDAALVEAVERAGYAVPNAVTVWDIEGMSCASCVGRVEKALARVPGVTKAKVNLATNQARVSAIDRPGLGEDLVAAVKRGGYALRPHEDGPTGGAGAEPRGWAALTRWPPADGQQAALALALAAPLVLPMAGDLVGRHWMLSPAWQCLLASLVQFVFGARFYRAAWGAVRAGSANMDLLVALGTSAAWGLSVFTWWHSEDAMPALYFESAAVVVALVRLGKWMEARARHQTMAALRALDALRPAQARVRGADGVEALVDVRRLSLGDTVVVLPGERLPVDGQVLDGRSHLDESALTGEALPVAREPGDTVRGGTLNGEGRLVLRTTALGAQTQIGRIVQLVASAQAEKAPIQATVDQVAAVFVPAVLVIALLSLVGWWWAGAGLSAATLHAVSVLVIACPCALGLATPATLVVASGLAARRGILVRDAAALERLRQVQLIVWDKTGTLTRGQPRLMGQWPEDGPAGAALLHDAACLQATSAHPLARALSLASAAPLTGPDTGTCTGTDTGPDGRANAPQTAGAPALTPADEARNVAGRGVQGRVTGRLLALGSRRWMDELGAAVAAFEATEQAWQAQGCTVSWLAEQVPGATPAWQVRGLLAFGDEPRPEAAAALAELRRQGVRQVVVSGDNAGAVAHLAAALGLSESRAGVTPEGKVRALAELRATLPPGALVAMVGDGINDAPALARADVGLAMMSAEGGTDVAAHTAGLTLMRGDLWSVVQARALSQATSRKIAQNLFWAFAFNALGLPLAALGHLSPVVAGGAMAISSGLVVGNALLLGRWRP